VYRRPPTDQPTNRPGESPQRAAALVQQELDRLGAEGPTRDEVARVKKSARAQLLGALGSNAGLASALVTYEVGVFWEGGGLAVFG
jgi:predicted Zn-dependent peptidase